MATVRSALTGDDVRVMMKGPTADERAAAAHKLCRRIDRPDLTEQERLHAHEILRVMAQDATELVRRALSVTLKSSPLLPRDVALSLARDVESVALPVLHFSPAFTDEDLADIVRRGGPARQAAIAKRPRLSSKVTIALVEHAGEEAVGVACANDNAEFTEAGLHRVLERFGRSEPVMSAVAYRKLLPMSVTEKLITMVSKGLRDHLAAHQALDPATALALTIGAGERATVDLIDQAGRAQDVGTFAAHLHARGRLSPSLLLRALAQGHMTFFEWGVAELAGVPHHRTWLMIHDGGPLGLRAIYERAGLPGRLFEAFRAGVDTFHALEFDEGDGDRQRFGKRMMQRFLTQASGAPQEDVDYLLEKMDRLAEAGAPPLSATA